MTHVFKPGEYKTRDGRKAVVLCDDAPGQDALVGYLLSKGDRVEATTWLSTGRYFGDEQHPNDLMPPEPEQVVRWVVLWNDSGVTLERSAPPILAGRKACTRVVLTPGRFDDENTPSEWDRAIDAALKAAADAPGAYKAIRAADAIRALKREGK